jgi:hypothetical protein
MQVNACIRPRDKFRQVANALVFPGAVNPPSPSYEMVF